MSTTRRAFLTGSFALLAAPPRAVEAQQAGRASEIGFLFFNTVSDSDNVACAEAVRQGLRKLGWTEGQNVAFEARGADGKAERLPGLADELARRNVKVVVATGNRVIAAAKGAGGGTVPVVGVAMYDPIGAGFIETYARPGGSVTGVTSDIGPEVAGKRFELLLQAAPKTTRVAILASSATPRTGPAYSKEVGLAAQRFGADALWGEGRRPRRARKGLCRHEGRARGRRLRVVGGYLEQASGAGDRFGDEEQVADDCHSARVPGVRWPDVIRAEFRRGLPPSRDLRGQDPRGARPTEPPVEQPTEFELVINLKAAKALGLTIPPSLLAWADHVIE